MPTVFQRTLAWLLALAPGVAWAEPTVEELPPPAAKSVLVNDSPTPAAPVPSESAVTADTARPDETDTPSETDAESEACWGMIGPSARHYFVGRLGIAHYWRDGQRQIAALEEQDPASLTRPDPNFTYYRERTTGNRWAIARMTGPGGGFGVYFQLADARGTWTRIQSARPTWDERPIESSIAPFVWTVPTCGD